MVCFLFNYFCLINYQPPPAAPPWTPSAHPSEQKNEKQIKGLYAAGSSPCCGQRSNTFGKVAFEYVLFAPGRKTYGLRPAMDQGEGGPLFIVYIDLGESVNL